MPRCLVERLLALGAPVGNYGRISITPLVACLSTGRWDLAESLLSSGADPLEPSLFPRYEKSIGIRIGVSKSSLPFLATPIQVAVCKLTASRQTPWTATERAKGVEVIAQMVEGGVHMCVSDSFCRKVSIESSRSNCSPLLVASLRGDAEVVRVLLGASSPGQQSSVGTDNGIQTEREGEVDTRGVHPPIEGPTPIPTPPEQRRAFDMNAVECVELQEGDARSKRDNSYNSFAKRKGPAPRPRKGWSQQKLCTPLCAALEGLQMQEQQQEGREYERRYMRRRQPDKPARRKRDAQILKQWEVIKALVEAGADLHSPPTEWELKRKPLVVRESDLSLPQPNVWMTAFGIMPNPEPGPPEKEEDRSWLPQLIRLVARRKNEKEKAILVGLIRVLPTDTVHFSDAESLHISPLVAACQVRWVEGVKGLIESGVEVNKQVRHEGFWYESAFSAALHGSRPVCWECIDALVQAGVNLHDESGTLALCHAIERERGDWVTRLLKRGASV
uniref:Uncharacterized protein n=1 Tax=Chromera velia CCMP2878 TaxID=1169474 RepID=A0A0G4I3E7_9ALVE|eukprot:Cvel_10656.t1-p1 / transcript=Cvel_10656.t1 / gene=Cvel_10656 / organism=Chromera_velia_CCMP2878 / gene_product=hypothetical protein / transcript_product=hypothetical protein / location=Cvel_scaffold647:54318-56270(+) / protein_length=502 / sequence_SO=supercontig / SO=protein_coding / is_pseudo=false